MKREERRYLNTFTPMGVRQYDPRQTEYIKKQFWNKPKVNKTSTLYLTDKLQG